jgi:glycosyltransferase involved in cell wall biosynthesis
MKRVLIPWNLSFYQAINGFHPLFSGLLEHSQSDISYIFPDPNEDVAKSDFDHIVSEVMAEIFSYGRNFAHTDEAYSQEVKNYLWSYLETRDLRSQALIYAHRERADLVFHHTTPLHLSSVPFVLHFENLTTLFFPFLLHGFNKGVDLRRELIFKIVKTILENPNCKAIFTHIKSSVEILRRSFASDIISAKVHYIPLGAGIPSVFSMQVEEKLASSSDKTGIRIVFTNSAHGAGPSFLLRGGHDLLVAFQEHRKKFDQSSLVIISSGREAFAQVHPDLLQGVEWIEQGINDTELFTHLVDADVFALPAAGLHSYSVLRAMRCGAVLICSDAPGYDEFVHDQETAFIVKGRRDDIYSCDPDTGWWRDDYESMKKFNSKIIEQLTDILNILAENPDRKRTMAQRAYMHVKNHHPIQTWCEDVTQLLNSV